MGVETNRLKGKEDKGKFNFFTQSIDMKECVALELNNAIKRVLLRKHAPLIMLGESTFKKTCTFDHVRRLRYLFST